MFIHCSPLPSDSCLRFIYSSNSVPPLFFCPFLCPAHQRLQNSTAIKKITLVHRHQPLNTITLCMLPPEEEQKQQQEKNQKQQQQQKKKIQQQQYHTKTTLYDFIFPGTHDSAAYTTNTYIPSRLTARTPLIWRPLRNLTASLASEFAITQTDTVLNQLRNGARFLDLRVTKPHSSNTSKNDDEQFWTHHGIVLCTPLRRILDDINTFHNLNYNNDNNTTLNNSNSTTDTDINNEQNSRNKISIVLVFRTTLLTRAEEEALATFVHDNLHHSIYTGDATTLRSLPLNEVPHNVVAGLCHGKLNLDWGKDPWVNTYIPRIKSEFLTKILGSSQPRSKRNDLLVIGWTITPSIIDIVLRVLTLGWLRSPLLPEAIYFNRLFSAFVTCNAAQLSTTANVIFFDAFTGDMARQVASLNDTHIELKKRESAAYQHSTHETTSIRPPSLRPTSTKTFKPPASPPS